MEYVPPAFDQPRNHADKENEKQGDRDIDDHLKKPLQKSQARSRYIRASFKICFSEMRLGARRRIYDQSGTGVNENERLQGGIGEGVAREQQSKRAAHPDARAAVR